VRIVVGDAKGKGLPAMQSAAAVLSVFREAAHQEDSLPLGLGHLADAPRIPVTIPFEAGDALLFYTDGASEARNKAGVFFPLADCAAVRAPPDPATLADRLGEEVIRYVGHAPKDDVTLLVAYRDGSTTAGPAHARMA